jgi:hypothetical protein
MSMIKFKKREKLKEDIPFRNIGKKKKQLWSILKIQELRKKIKHAQ